MAHAPTDTLSTRHDAIRRRLTERSLDALVVTSLPNVLYLTNFTGSSAIVILTQDRVRFITDSRYATVVEESRRATWACPDLDLVLVESSYDATLVDVLKSLGGARVGFEGAHLSVSRHAWLLKALTGEGSPELIATEGIVEHARLIKDPYELSVLREAGSRLSDVARSILSTVSRGQTEREVALMIETALHRAGFERPAFETIVASGPQAALPHARPTERRLGEGDLVVLDFGGVYDSYCVDLTRTVSVGPASARARQVHSAVLHAHDRAMQASAPGVSRFAVDGAARDALGEAGMAEAFGHGTGHGLGIEVHEDPRIGRRRPGEGAQDDLLQPGMVFTIEPGAYFPGWGGVRIEDDAAITASGVELLTSVTTELVER